METEPSFEDVLAAAAANEQTDAAADAPDADLSALMDAIMAGEGEVPLDAAAPAQESPDGEDAEEPLAASAETDGDDDIEADEDESEFARVLRERDELLQSKREADAQLAEQRAAAYWQGKKAQVDGRLMEAVQWLRAEVQSGRHYDPTEFVMRELPTILEGYRADLQEYHGEREQAAMQVARQHGTITWVASLEQRFDLSKAEVERVKRYPPEFMEQAAQDIAAARSSADPIKAELTATKSNLTKTTNALKRATGRADKRQQIGPSPVAGAMTFTDVKARITPDTAGDLSGAVLSAIFGQR